MDELRRPLVDVSKEAGDRPAGMVMDDDMARNARMTEVRQGQTCMVEQRLVLYVQSRTNRKRRKGNDGSRKCEV